MFKRYLIIVLLTFAVLFHGSNLLAQKIEPSLLEILNAAPPDSAITVIVRLGDRVNIEALNDSLNAINAGRFERYRTVMEALKGKANATQAQFLTYMASQKALDELSDYKAFWIDNVIFVISNHFSDSFFTTLLTVICGRSIFRVTIN